MAFMSLVESDRVRDESGRIGRIGSTWLDDSRHLTTSHRMTDFNFFKFNALFLSAIKPDPGESRRIQENPDGAEFSRV